MTHTVLMVDDDTELLYSLRRMLRNQPYLLHTARSAEEAIEVLKASDVDVVVVDERLPGMSGADMLAWVARTFPQVMRMMLTENPSVETVLRAVNEGGVYHFFTKPCNEAHLGIVIRKALEHRDQLTRRAELAEISTRESEGRERFADDLEVLNRVIARDLEKPLCCVARSCQCLMEQHRDLLDPSAKSLIEGTLDAIADMQILIKSLLLHTHAWQSTGIYGGLCIESCV